MKKEINRTLGNSLRCILPSFWWKRLLGKMVDKIESAESSASSAMKMATLAGMEASNKQDRLVSGSNIKTINGESILGGGNITIEAGDGVEQIIFYVTENDAYPLTAEEIAHNVESMQKQRTAFRNNTPVSFLVSVKGPDFQICEPASFYFPSNNTDIPVGFCIVSGGSAQFMVTCNWDGTANVKDLNWIDTELSDTSKNPVQNKAVKAYVDEKVANVGGTAIRELYIGDSLTDEQKAWNLETLELAKQGKAIVRTTLHGNTFILELFNEDNDYQFGYTQFSPSGGVAISVGVTEDGLAGIKIEESHFDSELSTTSINAVQNKVITAALNNKVDKVNGKQLSTEDFTSALKAKLEGLNNYDDTSIQNAVNSLTTQINTLVSGDASVAIENFNEIISFLNGIEDSESLDSIIASIEQQIANKQNIITDLTDIRNGAALGKTALQSIPTEYVTDSELIAKGYATTSQLVKKQDIISDLESIRSGAVLGTTSLQEHQDISHLATKEVVTNLTNDVLDNEEIYAAAVNDLNIRIVNADSVLSTEISNRESLQTEFQTFKTQVTENEEVWAIALTDINDRIDINYQHGEDTYATKNSLSNEIQTINTVIVDNEEIIAATLTDLNNQIASLNVLITDLTNRIETLENA